MKEQMQLRAHLLNKFDELPIPGNAFADWRNMEKALQVAMPIGLISFVLFGKGWLLSKKLVWIGITAVTCGGAATSLAVYQSRQASLAPAVPPAIHKQNKPNRGNTTSPRIIPPVHDTTVRISKKRKTIRVVRDTIVTSVIRKKTFTSGDTVIRLRRTQRLARVVRDTLVRPFRLLRPAGNLRDSLVRPRRILKPAGTLKNNLVLPPGMLRPAGIPRDSLVRPHRILKPAGTLKNSLVRPPGMLRPAGIPRDSLVRPRRILKPNGILKDSLVRTLRMLKPAGIPRDTIIRAIKQRDMRDSTIRYKAKPGSRQ